MRRAIVAIVTVVGSSAGALGCGSSDARDPATDTASETSGGVKQGVEQGVEQGDGLFPDVVDVTVERDGDTFRFDVTISSPYDTPERYADAWRVVGPDGTVLGVRELLHDHQDEQPFTRSLSGVEIPAGVDTVTIEGRDQVNGWGGATLEVELP